MTWERSYNTGLLNQPASPLGQGWTCPYFAKLTRVGKDYHFHGPDGWVEIFPDPDDGIERGKILRSLSSFREIRRQGINFRVSQWNVESGRVFHHIFQAGRNGQLWPLRAIYGHAGPGIELSWDEAGRLKGIRQTVEKRTLVVVHSNMGLILSVSLLSPSGQQTPLIRYEYDESGRLNAAIDAMNFTDRYEYDSSGRLVRDIRKDGQVFRFAYDDKGRCIRTTGLDGYDLKVLRYLESACITEVTNSHGRKSIYECRPTGQVVKHIDALGGSTAYSYDEHGRIVSIVDPMGSETKYEFDAEGNRCATIFPDGSFLKVAFNPGHLPISFEDSEGHHWKREYDLSERLIKAIDPDGSQWSYAYHQNGLLHYVVNPGGERAVFTYSPDLSVQEVVDFGGMRSRYAFDHMGRLVERTNPSGDIEKFRYDPLGRLRDYQTPNGVSIKYQRDAGGNTISVQHQKKPELRSRYGTCGRILEKRNAAGGFTRFVWGTEPAELLKIIGVNGEVTEFKYDGNGRTSAEIKIDGGVLEYARDAIGRVREIKLPSGAKVEMVRDSRGNLVERRLPDGSKFEFAYDKWGRLIAAASPDCILKFKRDSQGRVVEEEQDGVKITYAFNQAGRLEGIETALGAKIGYGYDEKGNFRDLLFKDKVKIRVNRNPESREIRRHMPGNIVLGHKYFPESRKLVQSLAKYPGGDPDEAVSAADFASSSPRILAKRIWEFDEYSALKTKTDPSGAETRYLYDELGRVFEIADTEGFHQYFGYDSTGNILLSEAFPTGRENYVYKKGQLLERKGDTEFKFDPDGRLIAKSDPAAGGKLEWHYEWDALDQLKKVRTPEGEEWTYAYDALGRRVSKCGPDGTTRYVWDRQTLLQESKSPEPPSTWLYAPGTWTPAGQVSQDTFYSVIPDHLGSPIELVDPEGQVQWSARASLWGKTEINEGQVVACPFRFPGQIFDPETGLHYNRFRYYDPETARFLTPDPLRHISGIGPYQYGPNPLNWVDPLGLMIVYRGMRTDSEGNPIVYSGPNKDGNNAGYSLGVRPEDKGKMSTIDDPAYLGDYKRPPGFDGADGTPGTMKKGAMFALDTDKLEQHGLVHDPDGEHHVSIKLMPGIPESELPERLAATRDQWEKVDPPEKKGDPEPDKKEGCAT